jgi:beta-N-acetylhexosaminidase
MYKTIFLLSTLIFCCNNDLLAEQPLSLRDKIGQMLILGFNGYEVNSKSIITKSISEDNLGGVILFDYNYQTKQYSKNIKNPQQLKQLTNQLQQITQIANLKHHRPQLPLIISVDYEGGMVNRLKERYGFKDIPSAAEIGKTSTQNARKIAETMATILNNTGFNLNFAPDIDVNINPNNPIIGKLGRSFSSNPYIVAKYANIYAKTFRQHGIQCVYKHFPGHGSSVSDSHLGFVDVTATWQHKELVPYQELLNKKDSCNIVMSAHIVNRKLDPSGLPATLSYKILTKLLRQQLKFNGAIVTDDLQMKAIQDHYGLKQALTLAINAGADLLVIGNQLSPQPLSAHELVDLVDEQVRAGKISSKRINDAYEHIVNLKQDLS